MRETKLEWESAWGIGVSLPPQLMTYLFDFFRKSTRLHWLLFGLLVFSGYARFNTLADRMTHCDDNGFLLNALGADSAAKAADNVSKAWTYAPGQYFVGFPLWSKAATFNAAVKAARMPSAIGATLGMLLFFLVIFLIQRGVGRPDMAGAFTAMIATLSMRAMVESQQGYSYAITYLFVALQLVAMVWIVQRDNLGWTRWFYALGASSFVGMAGLFFSYQMLFPSAAAGLACVIGAWREFKRSDPPTAYWPRPLGFAAAGLVGFGVGYLWLWKTYLEVLVKNGTSVPGWAQFELIRWSAADGISGYLGALSKKVLLLFSLLTAPIWPALVGTTAQLVWGGIVLLLAVLGVWVGWRSKEPGKRLLSLYGAIAVSLMLGANLAGLIPVGVTRHSFILFVPILGLLLCGELSLSQSVAWRKRFFTASVLGLLFFHARFDDFNSVTGNQFDVARLSKEVTTRRPIALVALDCTWDARLAQHISKSTAFPCGVVEDGVAAIKSLEAKPDGGNILFTSHRSDPLIGLAGALQAHPDWKAESLIALQPKGSTEPIGMVNGGNGFFLASITKPVTIQKGCALQFGSGWNVREGGQDWWRWTDHGGTVTVVSSQAEKLTLKGLVTSVTPANVLRLRLNGKPLPDISLNVGVVLNLDVQLSGAPAEFEFLSANAGIKLPPDTRTFAMQIRNWKLVGEKTGPCEIR